MLIGGLRNVTTQCPIRSRIVHFAFKLDLYLEAKFNVTGLAEVLYALKSK